MNKCQECGRPLFDSEDSLCPSCESNKSRNTRLWVEAIGTFFIGLGSLAWYMLSGDDDDDEDD